MDKFFSEIAKSTPATSDQQSNNGNAAEDAKKPLPKGVVLGKDGKPCRSCTSVAAWTAMIKQQQQKDSPQTSLPPSTSRQKQQAAASDAQVSIPPGPADVETLGRSTWTFLHTLSANYPPQASPSQQSEMRGFLSLFARLYPCWHCAEEFRTWMGRPRNEPSVGGRREFMRWMCEAHNEVNVKLGKGAFDCGEKSLEERWGDGGEG